MSLDPNSLGVLKHDGISCLLAVKKSSIRYIVVYPEVLYDGTNYILNRIVIAEFRLTGDFTELYSISADQLKTDFGWTNVGVGSHTISYNFVSGGVILSVGETNSLSQFNSAKVKFIEIDPDSGEYSVLIDDVVSLINSAVSSCSTIKYRSDLWIDNSLSVGVAGCYDSNGNELAVAITSTDQGSTWSVHHLNSYNDGRLEWVEPIKNNAREYVIAGHHNNGYWLRADGSFVGIHPWTFTVEPVYDPINKKVYWMEWGSSTGAVQHFGVSTVDDPSTITDKTPSDSIMIYGESADLSTANKALGFTVSFKGKTYVGMELYRGGLTHARTLLIDTESYSTYTPLERSDYDIRAPTRFRCIDPLINDIVPCPFIVARIIAPSSG